MKVLDLQCDIGHRFEGWFDDEADFLVQQSSKHLACPVCESLAVHKLPSSARLNLRGGRALIAPGDTTVATDVGADAPSRPERTQKQTNTLQKTSAPGAEQRKWLQAMRKQVREAEDVGEQFSDQALRMHRGELEEKPIRGQANREQVRDLLEEGVSVLPLPSILKDSMH